MIHDPQTYEEFTVAAYLAGACSMAQRAEMASYLAERAEARELLCMAEEALEAARHPEKQKKRREKATG